MAQTIRTRKTHRDIKALDKTMTATERMVEREHYYRGHRDCLLYLLRSGIFEAE